MATVALYSSATGLNALSTKLDVIANNLANVNTQGFKSSRANFQDLIYQEKRLPGVENASGAESPTGLYVGLGVKVSGTQLDFRLGAPIETGKALDLLIDGEGFFRVQVPPSVSGDGLAYTRAGNFTVNEDGELVLANDQGLRLDVGVTIPEDATQIEVSTDGRVVVQQSGSNEPVEVGQLEVVTFINPEGLKQVGSTLFTESGASGPPIAGEPGEEHFGQIRSGFLEGSNVDPTTELVELIRTQRAFEMNSQVIRAADDTLRTIGQLRQ